MLLECARVLGLVQSLNKDPRGRKDSISISVSASRDFSLQLKDYTVRIIHAGGREELYQNMIPASDLIRKYPGMCVALPGVFKNPHESILCPEEQLLPGQKYFIIPFSTVQKLKRKHEAKVKVIKHVDVKMVGDGEICEESVCSAKEFYTSRDKWSRCKQRSSEVKKKPVVPVVSKARWCKGSMWEPSLTSVQELSP